VEVKFFDNQRIYARIRTEVDQAIGAVLQSGRFILGNKGLEFEARFKEFIFANQTGVFVTCNSGTDALELSLKAAGVAKGSEVLVSAHTAIPTVAAIVAVGAVPCFVDIDPQTWLAHPESIDEKVTNRTGAIILVHLYGNIVDTQKFLASWKNKSIALIEDVAQASGSTLHGRAAGSFGDYGAFSFYPTKNIGAFGDGGGVFATDPEVGVLKMLRNYGKGGHDLVQVQNGQNSRMDELQAAVLLAQLDGIRERWTRRQYITQKMRLELGDLPFQFQRITDGCEAVPHLFVVALESNNKRDLFREHMRKKGVETLVHYARPPHLHPAFAAYAKQSLTNAEKLADLIVSLPMNCTLRDNEVDYVIDTARSFFA
jgi:dTDP-4-amino-4,6-dideoxygalactose transaminase